MTAFVADPRKLPAGIVPPVRGRRSTPRSGGKPGPARPPTGPGTPLRVTTTCLRPGCGWSETGLTSDPPTGPQPAGWGRWAHGEPETWTRWAELEYRQQRHPHPADLVAVPS